MKLLCIDPGASYATGDVARGFLAALADQGHAVLPYNLTRRIDDAAYYYRCKRRRAGLRGPADWREVLTKAAVDIVPFALYHRPDWVVVFSGMYLAPDMFVLLRRAGVRVALVLSESPYDDEQHARLLAAHDPATGARLVDLAFTNERTSVATLGRVHPDVHYLAHAYDPARSNADAPIPDDTPRHDVLFIGTLFEERIDLLAGVDWEGIDFAIYGSTRLLPSRHKLRRYVRGDIVDNRTAQAMYRAAKINLNPYRTSVGYGIGVAHIERAESLNPRALELAACGAFQISDWRREVAEVFGDTVPTWAAIETETCGHLLTTLVRRWLHPDLDSLRAHIAATSGALARDHTYAARAAQLTATLAAHGASREAQAAD